MTKLKKALKLTLILILVALALVCGAIVVFGGFEALAAVFLVPGPDGRGGITGGIVHAACLLWLAVT